MLFSARITALVYHTLLVLVTLKSSTYALDNGLARTPPMGWLSWERFRCNIDCKNDPDNCISANLYKAMADRIVADGYKDVGYEYVNVDDCWLDAKRDENQTLQADAVRFPGGIKSLADYIHSKGLKFGIYEDYGNKTCAGYPGVINNMEQDANTFAKWGVDYVKLDGCYADTSKFDEGYPEFGRYLNATKRPMVYSCSWPAYQETSNYTAIAEHCNLWRNYGDIDDSWSSIENIMDHFAENQETFAPHAGPGHWNDPDMLIIGNFGLSYDQSKVQMAVWAILAAPLIMSVDLRTIKAEYRDILQNKLVIDVNQDPLGIQGRRIYQKDDIEVWTRPISPAKADQYSYAIAFVSRRTDGAPTPFTITLKDLNLSYPSGYTITDLFLKQSYGVLNPSSTLTVNINPTGVVMLRADIN